MKLMSLFLTFLSFQALSQAPKKEPAKGCIVISGSKRDHNQVFNVPMFTQETTVIAGQTCTVVDGWTEAMILSNLMKNKVKDLLIVQGTHGDKNGNFACNSGDVSAEEVLKNLNQLASSFQVGAVIDSCFSGEVMRKKLIADQFHTESLSKLCLVTSSGLGRITYGSSKDVSTVLSSAKSGSTLEEVFANSYSGMISSAAWTEAGIPFYLTTKTASAAMKALQNVDSITRYDGVCDTEAEANTAICASPSVNNEVYELLSNFKDPLIKDDLKYYFHSNVGGKPAQLLKAKTESKATGTAAANYDNGIACYQGLFKFYQTTFGEKLENLQKLTELRPAIEKFTKDPAYKSTYTACENYRKSMSEEWQKNSLYYESFYNALSEYEKDQARLSRIFSTHRFDDKFDMIAFGKAAAGDKSVCRPEDKMQILQSMLGEAFFYNEYFSPWDPDPEALSLPDENILGRKLSTQIAMKGFQNASLARNKPQNPIDKSRSEACKNFKL